MICVAMLESKMENPKAGFWECSLSGNGSVPFLCQLSWGYETSQTLIKSQSILANTSEQLLVYHISGCFKYTVTDAPVSGQNITIHHHCWIFLDLMQVPWFSWLKASSLGEYAGMWTYHGQKMAMPANFETSFEIFTGITIIQPWPCKVGVDNWKSISIWN